MLKDPIKLQPQAFSHYRTVGKKLRDDHNSAHRSEVVPHVIFAAFTNRFIQDLLTRVELHDRHDLMCSVVKWVELNHARFIMIDQIPRTFKIASQKYLVTVEGCRTKGDERDPKRLARLVYAMEIARNS